MAARRVRPPIAHLALPDPGKPRPAPGPALDGEQTGSTDAAFDSPLELSSDDDDDDDDDLVNLSPSSSSSSSSVSNTTRISAASPDADDISKDLAALASLRKSVQTNLRLRPIRSFGAIPKAPRPGPSAWAAIEHAMPGAWRDKPRQEPPSPASATSSVYYTPSDVRSPGFPLNGHFPLNGNFDFDDVIRAKPYLDPPELHQRLSSHPRPLLIDTRPAAAFHSRHLQTTVNIAIPSLILRRCRRPGGGFQSIDGLRQFITSGQGKEVWDTYIQKPDKWDGSIVIIHGEETDDSEKDNMQVAAWALLSVISSLLGPQRASYLRGGMSAALRDDKCRTLVESNEHAEHPFAVSHRDAPPPSAKLKGVFQINTKTPIASNFQIEQEDPSPVPLLPSLRPPYLDDCRDLASPAPNQTSFVRPPPPRRPSAPNLRSKPKPADRLGVKLPKLQINTIPSRSNTLPVLATPVNNPPPPLFLSPQHSPSHLTLVHSNHSPASPNFRNTPMELQPPSFFDRSRTNSPRSPNTPLARTPSPSTARPDTERPLSTEGEIPVFTVSTILPNFLYLGPEMTSREHVEELKALGVKRILNMAAECDDDQGLKLKENFDRYFRIAMRDTVEEDKITQGLKKACEILDEASLYKAPTYVHCKAGKSRSVTAVIAYLIHANHWTLSRAYTFVTERRKGVSPNIGFVSELMTFEEQELGSKSHGVVQGTPSGMNGTDAGHTAHSGESGGGANGGGYAYSRSVTRPGMHHARESLPPMFSMDSVADASGDAGRDVGQEMEVKDASGRYRHLRRAPVDETTLQPMRRVSKAGLESSWI